MMKIERIQSIKINLTPKVNQARAKMVSFLNKICGFQNNFQIKI